jgi:hypothetical protein
MNGQPIAEDAFAGLPPIFAFEPWMIDAGEGWSGSITVSRTMRSGAIPGTSFQGAFETQYSCLGIENVSGRRALRVIAVTYAVESGAPGAQSVPVAVRTIWVDEEMRVTLKEDAGIPGMNSTFLLVRAPFLLQPEGQD